MRGGKLKSKDSIAANSSRHNPDAQTRKEQSPPANGADAGATQPRSNVRCEANREIGKPTRPVVLPRRPLLHVANSALLYRAGEQPQRVRNPRTTAEAPAPAAQPDITPGLITWPAPIDDVGMYGLAGEFVRLVEPHTEADRNILLLTFLVHAGHLLGRNFYLRAGADLHSGNLYLAIVGHTGHGRKGSAMSATEAFFRHGSLAPGLGRVLYGISSGEGIIHEIRDPTSKAVFDKKKKKSEETIVDPGVEEKRLLISLSELQQCFAMMQRQDSILSSVLRQGWDKDKLSVPSKNSGVKCDAGAHVSLVGGTSKEELLQQVGAKDAQNGTLNRILFACSRRSQKLPEGGQFLGLTESPKWSELQKCFNRNIANPAKHPIDLQRDEDAADDWGRNDTANRGMYNDLTQVRAGLWGDVTARAAQQVMRLSVITAVINGSRTIRREHQNAGEELWRYCDDSSKQVFGNRLDDPTASEIQGRLREAGPVGLTRAQIRTIWSRNKPTDEINRALRLLADLGLARHQSESTGGKPAERWFAL